MKILLATHFFPPGHLGGTETYTLGIAKTLQRMGHSPFVICAEGWGKGDSCVPRHEDTVYQGIPVRRLYWNWQLARDPFTHFYENPEAAHHVAGYVQSLQPDVVHVTSCYSLGAGIIPAVRECGVPVCLTLTDFWFLCPRHTLYRGDGSICDGPETVTRCQECLALETTIGRSLAKVLPVDKVSGGMTVLSGLLPIGRIRPLRGHVGDAMTRMRFLRRVFEDVSVAVAPSQFVIDVYARNGYPPDRILRLPHGLDLSWRNGSHPHRLRDRPCFGYLGQITRFKGVDLLVEAFRSMSPRPQCELRVYGDLSKEPEFSDRLFRMAVGDKDIHFMGPFERSQLANVLSSLDVVVVPSVWLECFGLVILEAFAAGKPVIVANRGGMRELVDDGVNGLLFEPGDVRGLAQALCRLAEDQGLLGRLSAGIEPVRPVQAEVESLTHLYLSAVRGKRGVVNSSTITRNGGAS